MRLFGYAGISFAVSPACTSTSSSKAMSLPNIRCVSCACFASLLALGFVAAASADTKLWNTNSGLFADPASWIGGVPGLGDVAFRVPAR
jgi:hypothetical protein